MNGKVTGAEPHRQMLDGEEGAAEINEAALELAHMRGLIDQQAFDLVEHRRMRRIMVAAEGAARHDDPDRRLCR